MPRPRFFYSASSKDWISPLIVVSRGLVSVANCVPFPYVKTALSGGLALLELIEAVGKTTEELKYLAESVVTIMKLLREEIDAHPTNPNPKFHQICVEFNIHLDGLSKDIGIMAKDWSSSTFKKYVKTNGIRDEIAQFTRRVADLRADATLIAAVGTRMDLVEVANTVTAVQSSVSEIRNELAQIRSGSSRASLNDELVRFEEDFHVLKLGDIELKFDTAQSSNFIRLDRHNRQEMFGWTDYKGSVKGSVRTIRVYHGSESTESWKGFLSVLADHSPSPYLPQLFGFCRSPRMKSLVFHGESKRLDEYGRNLGSPQALVDWEMALVSDFSNLKDELSTMGSHVWFGARQFASVNAENGKLLMTHAELTTTDSISRMNTWKPEPFLEWFMSSPTLELDSVSTLDGCRLEMLMFNLTKLMRRRRSWSPRSSIGGDQGLISLGKVYRARQVGRPRHATLVATLKDCQPLIDPSWHTAFMFISPPTEPGWFPSRIPSVDGRADPGWTHFVVPLMKSHAWTSVLDYSLHRGYFLTAQITFSTNMGMPEAWIAQSGVFIPDHSQESDPSEFLIPIRTAVILMWEMVLCQEETGTTTGSLALLETIPSNIHVFLQVPTLDEGRIQEPRMYWSTDPLCIETSLIPPGMFKIRFGFGTNITLAWWEKHHYDAARSILEECGFDPRTIAAANSLNLPLFEPYHGPTITFPLSPADPRPCFTVVDPHLIDLPVN